jgi:hypothetical protein
MRSFLNPPRPPRPPNRDPLGDRPLKPPVRGRVPYEEPLYPVLVDDRTGREEVPLKLGFENENDPLRVGEEVVLLKVARREERGLFEKPPVDRGE